MPEQDLKVTIPQAKSEETTDEKVTKMERWLAGHVDDKGAHVPGLVQMVHEMYQESKARKERREFILRGLTVSSIGTLFVGTIAWLKDHYK